MIDEKINLPSEFLIEMEKMLGSDYEKYLTAFNSQPSRGLRVNLKRISVENFLKVSNLKLKKLPFSTDGYLLENTEKIGNSFEHLSGLFYLQEPSSMLPVVSSGVELENKSLKILDLCASPGGKTGQIVSRISDESVVFSNEIIKSRADVLFSNVERLGFKNVIILNEEPKNLLNFKGFFDYVFVDAPCSGEGMFRKNPETISEWNTENVILCKNRQKEILDIAQQLVCPNGKLIYSTCTFSKEEDEEIIEWFCSNYNYSILDVPEEVKNVTISSNSKVKNGDFARKFLPYLGDGEGQFLCVLKNNNEETKSELYKKKHYRNLNIVGRNHYLLFENFANENLSVNYKYSQIVELGETLFLVPSLFDEKIQTALDDLKITSIGVKLGSIEKNRFEPNHNIFMTLFENFNQKIELSDENLKKYLHGEELFVSGLKNGYCVVTKNNYPIGGVKVVGNRLKNLYPKGLRI